MIYSKVTRAMWGDRRFAQLSRLKPSGQALFLYLLTGPHTTPIPGVIPSMGIGVLADRLKWSRRSVHHAFRELERQEMAVADFNAGVLWLPNAIEHNSPRSPNAIRAMKHVVVPQCPLVITALLAIRDHLAAKPNAGPWLEAFADAFAVSFPDVVRDLVPVPELDLPPAVGRFRVTRIDRKAAQRIRETVAACPHDPPCESFTVCLEEIATKLAQDRHTVRARAGAH